mmetsp:Transcript_19800/g.27643  ORF Transcript_19800/g.27643 Transcript_19800/m.27643 type:complete len:102 (+) Transcript_19800:1054-1359(+)
MTYKEAFIPIIQSNFVHNVYVNQYREACNAKTESVKGSNWFAMVLQSVSSQITQDKWICDRHKKNLPPPHQNHIFDQGVPFWDDKIKELLNVIQSKGGKTS